MEDKKLRAAVRKLAAEKPELRKHLVPLLKKAGGKAISSGLRNVRNGLSDAKAHLESLQGLFEYRLRGEGHKNPFTGEPSLNDRDRKLAMAMQGKLRSLYTQIEKVRTDVGKLDSAASKLDGPLNYM
jgi:hypothetical protein